MGVEDRARNGDEIPYRLYSGWDSNSEQYHRAVYHCIQGKFHGHIELNDRDNHDLFNSRRKIGWNGPDSLYDAWLLANHNESRSSFDRELFTRYLYYTIISTSSIITRGSSP